MKYTFTCFASLCCLCIVAFGKSGGIDICSQSGQVLKAQSKANAIYQWQMRADSNATYYNLQNNAIFSGVNDSILSINNLSSAYYGRAIRCRIVDAITGLSYSDTVFFRIKNSWNGGVSSSWDNPANWSCGQVPDSNTDVVITKGSPRVNQHSKVRSLTISNGANVRVNPGFTLRITSDKSKDIELKSNVYVVDSTLFSLNMDSTKLENGIYEFTLGNTSMQVSENDIIVGYADVPFARKIKSIQSEANRLILQTEPASLGDIFQNLSMHQTFNSAGAGLSNQDASAANQQQQGEGSVELNHIFNNLSIYSNASASVSASGNVSASGAWDFDLQISDGKVKYAFLGATALNFNAEASFKFQTNGTYNLPGASYETELFKAYRIITIYAGIYVIPIYMEFIASLEAEVSVKAEAALTRQVTVHHTSGMRLGVEFSNGGWRTVSEPNSNTTLDYLSETDLGFEAEGTIGPVVSLKFYKLAGPYISFPVSAEMAWRSTQQPNQPKLWDFKAQSHLDFRAGVKAGFAAGPFDLSFFDYFYSKKFLTKRYTTPYEIQKITPGNPIAGPGEYLAEPVKVKVLDQEGNPEKAVGVFFEVMSGGGLVNFPYAYTDVNGMASMNWSLGTSSSTPQKLKVSAFRSDNSTIQSAPLIIEAYIKDKPIVTTNYMHAVSANFGYVNCTLQSSGGSPIKARGVCWNTTGNPTVFDNKSYDGTALGSYYSFANQLTHQTTYYVRAYAINQTDTGYGNVISFTTTPPLPLILNLTSNGVTATATTDYGVPPYKYSWNGGPLSDNNTFSDVSVRRNITVKVVDAVGAELTRSDICVGAWGNFVPSPCTVQQFRYYVNGYLVCTLSLNQTQNAIFVGSHDIRMVGVTTGVTHTGSSTIQPGQNCIQWFTCCPNANTCSPNLCD